MQTKLESILKKENLDHLLTVFVQQGVTDSILIDLSSDDLRDLGIDKLGERKRLLAAFADEMHRGVTNHLESPEAPTARQEDFTYEASHGSITITGFRGSGHAIVPQQFDGLPLPVQTIAQKAFQGNGALISVVIPEGVTHIEHYAFTGCTSLTCVTMPDSLGSIHPLIFAGCPSLQEIRVSEFNEKYSVVCGVLYNKILTEIIYFPNGFKFDEIAFVPPNTVTRIGDYSVSGCTKLTSIVIPDGVTHIGHWSFCNCTNATTVTIPDSMIEIGGRAFSRCTSLTSVTIPDGVTHIGCGAFSDCTSLTSVTIPDSVTRIEEEAFTKCDSLTSVTIGNGVTQIDSHTFAECQSLTSVTIANGLTVIGTNAFLHCRKLTSVTLPDSLIEIADGVFYGCSSLRSVTLPQGLARIGDQAFEKTGLSNVALPDTVKWIGEMGLPSYMVAERDERRKPDPARTSLAERLSKWIFPA